MRIFLLALTALALQSQQPVSFNREIRPIMADTCFRCHGPDKSSRMANMRLDLREEAVKPNARGRAPIVPGNPEQSEIVRRIFTTNSMQLMPPASAHKTLTAAQKDTIRRWVAEGAVYEGHWAYEPLRRGAATASIDGFIAAKQHAAGLTMSAEADRATLIRRLALDLTGVPPAPTEVAAFVAGEPYIKVVDRMIASQRYAEKQAMHWLDGVRYADTAGFHGDNPFPAWPYRDYVLRSIHENQPFDQFTREQLAGDLLPGATTAQKTASAYNRINRVSAEGGLQPKEYLAKYAADRVRTTATVWLGSTLGCAECHDHKFDPFTAKDFYSFKAFFADIKETGLVPDRGPKAWGALLDLSSERDRARRAPLAAAVESSKKAVEAKRAASKRDEKALLGAYEKGSLAWTYQVPVAASATKATLKVYNDEPAPGNIGEAVTEPKPGDGLIVASGANPDNETYTITLEPGAGRWLQLGVQAMQDESLLGLRIARGSDRLMVSEIEAELLPERRKLRFSTAASSIRFQAPEQHPMNAIDGNPQTGWGASTYGDAPVTSLALRFETPLATTAQSRIVVRILHDSEFRKATIGRLRLALSKGLAMPVSEQRGAKIQTGLSAAVVAALKKSKGKRNDEDQQTIVAALDWTSPAMEESLTALKRAEAALGAVDATAPRVMISESVKPEVTRILNRGNFMDDSGAIVEPAVPAFLGKVSGTRLDLANWLASRDNPLTARAYVNRQWRLFFGAGLSRVLEDLGSQGEWPTHPELLDWLASEFVESGWDRKHITKLIVMSKTYRQSSTGAASEKDPENRLLAKQNRWRVDAEVVRDIALSVSGLLVERFGGPSVRPYQPEGFLAALNFPKRDYSASRGDDQYRRGLYTFWQRTFLHPSLMTFDAATREECTVNRSASNTPLQALVLLNDPTYVEAARVFAQNAYAGGGSPEARIEWAFQRAVGRAPSARERAVLLDLYKSGLRRFDSDPSAARRFLEAGEAQRLMAPPAELAATMTVTRAILNLHETITRN
ncbi:MAG: DUF1553 domain-containing protein [Acidobacteria bacterium]|nr:DUF1553 domain-containing protein [Acidobacteriota bacterium]